MEIDGIAQMAFQPPDMVNHIDEVILSFCFYQAAALILCLRHTYHLLMCFPIQEPACRLGTGELSSLLIG